MNYSSEDMKAYFAHCKAECTVLCRFDEFVNCKLFSSYFSDRLCYVRERKCWFYYENGIWRPDIGDLTATKSAKVFGRSLLNYAVTLENDSIRQTAVKVANRWQSFRNVQTLIKNAASEFPVSMSEFDSHPYLLNFQNGTYDLSSNLFREHSSADKLTRMMNADYNPDARCERFGQFIDEIMQNDPDMVKYLCKALGYGLDGACREECLFILYGASTRNGKSTLAESIIEVMGSYGTVAEPETLARRNANSSGPSEDVARLRGVRLVGIAEQDKNLVFNASRVKTLTGNDTVIARFLHENSFQFRPEATFYINTNHLPQVTDITLFTSNRLRVIPFERHFAPCEQQRDLKQLFREEEAKSAIANFLISGYQLWQLEGLAPPEKVKQAQEEYLTASDRVKQFITECLRQSEGAYAQTSEIYMRYRTWCAENGYQPYALNKFCESLKRYGTVRRIYRNNRQSNFLMDYKIIHNLD